MPTAKNRLTVVEHVYHLPIADSPTESAGNFTRLLDSFEQPYCRNLVVGPNWQPLDLGWLKGAAVGMLILYNRAGLQQQTIPTEEEKLSLAAQTLEVTVAPASLAHWVVLPGESMRAMPIRPQDLLIRSGHGSIPVNVFVVPR